MESSRGGPLTTFIMMLPLIVVPTIAMLKPAGENGVVSDLLSAATGGSEASPEDAPAFPESDSIEDIFGPSSDDGFGAAAETETLQDAPVFSEVDPGTLLSDFDLLDDPAQAVSPVAPSDAVFPASPVERVDSQELLRQLEPFNVSRSLWFSPDGQSAGFVAFLDDGRGLRYRFEAVAATRDAAVRDVIMQIQEWQRKQGQ